MKPALSRSLSLFAVLAVSTGWATLLFLSCTKKTGVSGQELFSSPSDLAPFANPGPKASIILLSTELPVDVDYKYDGKDLTIRLKALNQDLEVEKYRSEASKFLLVQAAGESFDPPLPLLDFPIKANQKLEWKGELKMGSIGKDATASTIITQDALNEKGLSGPAIKSSVELSFAGGAPTLSKRMLTFWFVPGKGIQKRMIDKGSTRLPATPTPEKT
jgi:hypothetical protein